MKRKGSAVWKGNLKEGKGTVSTGSELLVNAQYSFGTRFEEGKGRAFKWLGCAVVRAAQ